MGPFVYITGHRNPDTDSICSAIAYADLKQQLGVNALACRIGDLNAETEYVLKKFNVPKPLFIENAKCRIADIDIDQATLIGPNTTVRSAWEKITRGRNKSLFVVDDQDQLLGVVSMSNISDVVMTDIEHVRKLMREVPLENLKDTLEAEVLVNGVQLKTSGEVILMHDRFPENQLDLLKQALVVVSGQSSLQQTAVLHQAACLIVTDGKSVDPDVLSLM